jgi:hypothetical protein
MTPSQPVWPAYLGWLDQALHRERRPLDLHVGRKPLRYPPFAGNRERVCAAAPVLGNRRHPARDHHRGADAVVAGRVSCLRQAGALRPTVTRMAPACQTVITLKRALGAGAPPYRASARSAPGVPPVNGRHSERYEEVSV